MPHAPKMNALRNAVLAIMLGVGLSMPNFLWHCREAFADETVVAADVVERVDAGAAAASQKPVKDETVIAFADATGTVYETQVKDKLVNTVGAVELFDSSSLTDIEPGGDMEYTASGQRLTWKAKGSSITYEGKTDLPCPVQMKIAYTLDGTEVSPDQIAGASGKVAMRFDFQNTATTTATIDGREQTIYTPFVVLCGFSMGNDHFSNIEVTNAKATAGTTGTTIAGYAMPGMQENLALDAEDFELPSYFEVTADATDFELGTTTTIVVSGLLDDVDTGDLGDGNVRDSLNAMSGAMAALINGTSSLYDGLEQLAGGMSELDGGLDALADSAGALPDGASEIASGADALSEGAKQVNSGMQAAAGVSSQMVPATVALQSGIAQVAETARGIGADGLQPAAAAVGAAQANASSIDAAAAQTADEIRTTESAMDDALASLDALSDTLSTEDQAKVDAAKASLADARAQAESAGADISGVSAATGTLAVNLQDANTFLATAIAEDESLASNLDYLAGETQAEALATKAKALDEVMGQLAGTTGAMQEGAESLSAGVHDLADAAPALVEGIAALKAGSSQLSEGTDAAADGSLQLASGLQQFNSEGVDQLVTAYDDNLGGLADRMKATVEAGRGYDNFSGIDPSMTGTVKFIYETDPIKAD